MMMTPADPSNLASALKKKGKDKGNAKRSMSDTMRAMRNPRMTPAKPPRSQATASQMMSAMQRIQDMED